jgi:hypothetical protein
MSSVIIPATRIWPLKHLDKIFGRDDVDFITKCDKLRSCVVTTYHFLVTTKPVQIDERLILLAWHFQRSRRIAFANIHEEFKNSAFRDCRRVCTVIFTSIHRIQLFKRHSEYPCLEWPAAFFEALGRLLQAQFFRYILTRSSASVTTLI